MGTGKLRVPRAVEPLLPLLGIKRKLSETAAWALGTIADERRISSLTQTLTDEDAELRDAAQNSRFDKNEKEGKITKPLKSNLDRIRL